MGVSYVVNLTPAIFGPPGPKKLRPLGGGIPLRTVGQLVTDVPMWGEGGERASLSQGHGPTSNSFGGDFPRGWLP